MNILEKHWEDLKKLVTSSAAECGTTISREELWRLRHVFYQTTHVLISDMSRIDNQAAALMHSIQIRQALKAYDAETEAQVARLEEFHHQDLTETQAETQGELDKAAGVDVCPFITGTLVDAWEKGRKLEVSY